MRRHEACRRSAAGEGILICSQCNCDFKPWRLRQKFCSHGCHDESRKKVNVRQLQQLAAAGETKAEIARQLGVSYMTVRRWISQYGLEQAWREQRYA